MSKTEKSERACVVCRVPLDIRTSHEYRGDPMHAIMGPGSRNQMTTVVSTSCPQCGLKYVNGGGVPPNQETKDTRIDALEADRAHLRTRVSVLEETLEKTMERVPWGELPGDDKDPNFGRSCMMCNAAIRAGGRLGHSCDPTLRAALQAVREKRKKTGG